DIYLFGPTVRCESWVCRNNDLVRVVRTIRIEFEEDLLKYSRIRSPNLAQLYGIVQWDLPAMILHDELIPYNDLLSSCISRPMLYAYLKYRFGIDSLQAALLSQGYLSLIILPTNHWMQPASGLICLGPDSSDFKVESAHILNKITVPGIYVH
ncbi:hypothetical protein BDP27DRAFT_1311083, partial [Rhodocollybia butyracea]